MESSLRGHATYQQQQQQQQQQYYQHRQTSGGGGASSGGIGGHLAQHDRQHPHMNMSDQMSVNSNYSRGSHASSQQSSQVDEAYRRLGHRLSRRAHGDQPVLRPQRLEKLGLTIGSGFVQYLETQQGNDGGEISRDGAQDPSGLAFNNRTAKVAKTRYNDHGDHQSHKVPSLEGNVLKKMTMNCAELFRLWQTDALAAAAKEGRKKKKLSPQTQQNRQLPEQQPEQQPQQSPTDLSPHRFAFSRLGLEAAGAQLPQNLNPPQNNHLPNQQLSDHFHTDSKLPKNQGLSSVMESNSLTSSGSHSKRDDDGASLKSKSSMTSSIATKSSINAGNISLASARTLPQGKCLTQPNIPIANDNLDNSEGNMIAFENDIISVSRKQVHVLTKDKMQNTAGADFRIQTLLGQGTFAQVFRCLHLQTGKLVAVKIVKNKPAYTRQAAVEIDVFRALTNTTEDNKPQTTQGSGSPGTSGAGVNSQGGETKWDYMVDLVCYFMHKSHLCLVFELLGLNLYEVLKRRQFRGLPLPVVRTLVRQAVGGIKELSQKSIVHCDVKPENILLVTEDDVESVVAAGDRLSSSMEKKSSISSDMEKRKGNMVDSPAKASGLSQALGGDSSTQTSETAPISPTGASSTGAPPVSGNVQPVSGGLKIKLIDFGSACFEGQTAHTYIQSRFYRSPEVLIGLPYDSAIDMWSLGCVAAELFLGLPILPGAHEHDQLGRICEMIAKVPDSMLDQGSKASKYFVKYVPRGNEGGHTPTPPPQTPPPSGHGGSTPRPLPQWRIRTQQEYIASLSQSEIRKKGGLAKLEKQPTNRYFKRKQLADIIMHKGQNVSADEKELLELFVHFLYGILDPDPWKRWTSHQAAQHPFATGGPVSRRPDHLNPETMKDENQANILCDIYWEPPWDPGICRRKLLNVQKMREKQQSMRVGYSNSRPQSRSSHDGDGSVSSRSQMHDSPSRGQAISDGLSPGQQVHAQRNNGQAIFGSSTLATQMQQQQRSAYQMSSSLSDFAVQPGITGSLAGDNTSVGGAISGSRYFSGGPQSYSDNTYASVPTEPDFAYALQRPGVVPMGESVSSSVDMSSHSKQQQHRGTGSSYGSSSSRNHVQQQQQQRTNQRNSLGALTSRSYGDIDHGGGDPRRQSLNVSLGQMSYNSQSSYGGQYDMGVGSVASHPSNGLARAFGEEPTYHPQDLPSSVQSGGDFQNQHVAYGNAQAYLQQQHAALQQQQALLVQQQAALALQQQQLQLQAYSVNPNVIPSASGARNLTGVDQYGQIGGGGQGGYYYVSSADGTPMLLQNPGGMQRQHQQSGMPNPYGQHNNNPGYPNDRGNYNGQGFHPASSNGNYQGGTSM